MQGNDIRIARTARLTRWAVIGLLTLTIGLQILAYQGTNPHFRLHGFSNGIAAGVILIMHTAFMVMALIQLLLMLAELERGRLFSVGVTMRLRRFALFAVLAVVSSTLGLPLLMLAFPNCAPSAECMRRFPIDMQGLWMLVISLLFFLVARILDEARRIDDENRQII